MFHNKCSQVTLQIYWKGSYNLFHMITMDHNLQRQIKYKVSMVTLILGDLNENIQSRTKCWWVSPSVGACKYCIVPVFCSVLPPPVKIKCSIFLFGIICTSWSWDWRVELYQLFPILGHISCLGSSNPRCVWTVWLSCQGSGGWSCGYGHKICL